MLKLFIYICMSFVKNILLAVFQQYYQSSNQNQNSCLIFEMKAETSTWLAFKQRTEFVFAIPLPRMLKNIVGYTEYLVSVDFLGSSITMEAKKKQSQNLDQMLIKALSQMSKHERIQYYFKITEYILKLVHGHQMVPHVKFENIKMSCYFRLSNKRWEMRKIQFCIASHFVSIEDQKNSEKFYIDLSLYLYRKSKNKTYYAFVLEACDYRVAKALRTLSIGFKTQREFNLVSNVVKQSVYLKQYLRIKTLFNGDSLTKNCINSIKNQKMNNSCGHQEINSSYCKEQLYFSFQQLSFTQTTNIQEQDITQESSSSVGQVLRQISNFPQKKQNLSQPKNNIQIWNINEKLTKMEKISKQNLLISDSQFELYKIEPDTLYLNIRHQNGIKVQQNYKIFKFLPSKQIESILQIEEDLFQIHTKKFQTFINPLTFRLRRKTIEKYQKQIIIHQISQNIQGQHRTVQYQSLWVFQNKGSSSSIKVLMRFRKIDKLNSIQDLRFLINYLKGVYETFSQYCNPCQTTNHQINFFSVNQLKIDESSKIVISQKYLKNKFSGQPIEKGKHEKIVQYKKENILTDEWRKQENGGLEYMNMQKIAAQKSVVKHIVKQMGKNLFSGKSILSLSLPVQIFSAQSHLERILHSFRLAPSLIQRFCNQNKQQITQKIGIQILQNCAILGITNSLLYLNQQKSFNPILGETCQQWIDGCPAYAQQISHHPPISAVYIVGRGYKIYGRLQAKVQLGLNSGKGSNDGKIVIEFDNGLIVQNYFAAGEVSGLSFGKRKFNITCKSYHFIESLGILLEVDFQPKIKNANSAKSDYFNSRLLKIQPTDIIQLQKRRKIKHYKPYVPQKETNQLQTIHGNWPSSILLSNNQQFKVSQAKIEVMSKDSALLPSDSIWRQDIYYRKRNDLIKSQQQKCRLEQIQRNDRNLRQKRKNFV